MKLLKAYEKIGCSNGDQVFDYLTNHFKESITTWNYFVEWTKVFGNVKDLEVSLNILNYLIGKDDFEKECAYILKKHPAVQLVFPILIACRDRDFSILTSSKNAKLVYENYSFKNKPSLSDDEIKQIIKFAKETGIADLFTGKKIKNVIDFVIGVEVGLDSNGRKNRGGTQMEEIVESFLEEICRKNNFRYVSNANADVVKTKLGKHIPFDKSSRRYDFVIDTGQRTFVIETNFYGGGGSKLKATAGEYKVLFDSLKKSGYPFIWITDGQGWSSTERPLRETFDHIDYVLNLAMIESGLLEDVLKRGD